HIQAKTLFSTHYHELTSLEDSLETLKNIHVRAEEFEGKVVFLHQIKEGAADESYGIHVAKLADLPDTLIERATKILTQLEANPKKMKTEAGQLSLFEVEEKPAKQKNISESNHQVIDDLKNIDLFDLTPLEA